MSAISIEEAYEKWGDELIGYATAIAGHTDAADIVSDAFSGLLRNGLSDRAGWNGAVEPPAYLFRCVLNAAKTAGRATGRRRQRELRVSAWGGAPAATPESLLADPAVSRAADALSPQQRAVVYLTYWDDMTPRRVAETLDISVGSVKRHLARGRSTLRKALT